jgi:acetyltransferase
MALDARIIVDRTLSKQSSRPYSHLAIRPYPEEFTKTVTLKDGTLVRLRPIQPEDEDKWHELLRGCSPESIRARFRFTFQDTTHNMATRFCFIDYDREIAIVAERVDDPTGQLMGVGRMVADADHREAEYAVLVGDHWQGQGLGSMLTDYCLDVCRTWGVKRIVAETAQNNHRMLELFRKRGFVKENTGFTDTVLLMKILEKEAP